MRFEMKRLMASYERTLNRETSEIAGNFQSRDCPETASRRSVKQPDR
jgi:hypothetical protein